MYRGFTKKLNSTMIPVETDVSKRSYQCNFLDAQSIMNPVIVIEDTQGNSSIMMEFTYAYIPSLSRYYFISNTVVVDNKRWVYYLQVDVLASFKDDIINSRQYVLRSTNMYNDYITDTMYPTVPLSQNQRFYNSIKAGNVVQAYNNKDGSWEDVNFFNQNYSSGSVIFGVTGQGNVSVDYYVATVSNFKSFITAVVRATPTGVDWGNLPPGVQTTLSNLMQYITFAKWLPFMPLQGNLGGSVSDIYLGTTSIPVTAYRVVAGMSKQTCKFTLNIPNHPLISQHGYYNLSPYREVSLFFLPLGIIPIDTAKIWNVSTLYIYYTVDLASANTEFTVLTSADDNSNLDHILFSSTTNIGVDLSLTDYSMTMEAALASAVTSFVSNAISQMKSVSAGGGGSVTHTSSAGVTHGGHGRSFAQKSVGSSLHTSSSGTTHGGMGRNITSTPRPSFSDIMNTSLLSIDSDGVSGVLADFVSNVAQSTSNALGNALQPIGDVLGTASDFIASSFGQATTTGHTGSFLMYMATMPCVFCWFYKHGDEDYARFGRPYFQNARLDSLTGFCVCRNAYVEYSTKKPLKPEIEGVDNLLNTGVYLE